MSLILTKRIRAVLLFASALSALYASAEKTPPSIAISISAPKNVVQAGAQTCIDITITNISDRAIALPYDSSGKAELSGFRFDVTRADGKQPKIMKYYWDKTGRKASKEDVKDVNREYIVVSNLVSLPLQPKKTVKYYAVTNDLYDLSVPGQYTIKVNGTTR